MMVHLYLFHQKEEDCAYTYVSTSELKQIDIEYNNYETDIFPLHKRDSIQCNETQQLVF